MEILSRTTVGSTMWKMNNSKSDKDYFDIYLGSTKDLLKGLDIGKSTFTSSPNEDVHIHELGKVINQLIKGNINFIYGVTSPIINKSTLEFRELRRLAIKNISKNSYHSIRGFALGNWMDYIDGLGDITNKKCKVVLRGLNFGINLLKHKKLVYKSVRIVTPERIRKKFDELDIAYEKSTLPEKPDEYAYREFLYKVRKDYLINMEIKE